MRFDSKQKVYAAVLGTTGLSVLMSLLITIVLQGGVASLQAVTPAIVVPLCVAPLVSFWGFSQAHRIELLNIELATLLNHDPLTNVHSRSYFFEAAARGQESEAAVILMVDADHFKNINDTYGHQIGDKALQHISDLISLQCRRTDVVARLGGEEFGIYMPHTEISTGRLVAERIRIEISSSPLVVDGSEISMSTSIGIAQKEPGESIEDVLKRADMALYQAKAEGRNRVKLDSQADTEVNWQRALEVAV